MLPSNGDNLRGGGRDGGEEETGSSAQVHTAALRRGLETRAQKSWERRDSGRQGSEEMAQGEQIKSREEIL